MAKININQNQLYSAAGALDPRFIVDSVDKITSISNAYVGLEVSVIDSEENTIEKYRIKKINSLTKKPLPANEGGYELIQELKDLKYSDGETPFLGENGNINSDPTIDPLPPYSSSENGKVLGLDNKGTLTWVSQPDNSGKADKVSNATADNFAALDGNGNLKDSGKKSSDFATPVSVTIVQSQVTGIRGNYVKTTTSGDDPVMDSSFNPANDCVRVDETQNLTEAKKQIARNNINAINGNDLKTINGKSLFGSGNITTISLLEDFIKIENGVPKIKIDNTWVELSTVTA